MMPMLCTFVEIKISFYQEIFFPPAVSTTVLSTAERYLELGSVRLLANDLNQRGIVSASG
jgi:hypothetical protein